jgi:hypothetical protein
VLTIRDLYSKITEDTEKVYDLKIFYVSTMKPLETS